MDEVTTIPNSCPICGGELRGNKTLLYFCRRCFIYFSENDIVPNGS